MPGLEVPDALDPCDVSLVYGSDDRALLAEFNRAGVLLPADVHTAERLARLAGESDELVLLATALAVRAPRVGHVSVDLATVRSVAGVDAAEDVDIDDLPWPDPGGWSERVSASPLVAAGEDGAEDGPARPLRLIGTSLYLDRYWRDEVGVAADLRARAGAVPDLTDAGWLAAGLARLFRGARDLDQLLAVETAVGRRFTVIAGGPGTGKTTTVARLLAVLHELASARGERPPLIGLAAPTGKAAARLEEAVRLEAAGMVASGVVAADTGRRLAGVSGSTLHRLLGSRAGTSRFRHHRGLRLPHDVIVVDEASMVSLALMARLVEAVRPDARLVLVGDPQQLVSVEAGAVLGDVVGPAGDGAGGSSLAAGGPSLAADGAPVAGGSPLTAGGSPPAGGAPVAGGSPLAGSIAVLRTNHRFSGALADLAAAVETGDGDRVVQVLGGGGPSVAWLEQEPVAAPAQLRSPIANWTGQLIAAARRGDRAGALRELARHRVLCAHRRGADGVSEWNHLIEALAARRMAGSGYRGHLVRGPAGAGDGQ